MTNQNLVENDEFGIPVHVIAKNSREQIRISINEYKGNEYIDIRLFTNYNDQCLPTKKGITLSKKLYPELLHGIILLGEVLGYDYEGLLDNQQVNSNNESKDSV